MGGGASVVGSATVGTEQSVAANPMKPLNKLLQYVQFLLEILEKQPCMKPIHQSMMGF